VVAAAALGLGVRLWPAREQAERALPVQDRLGPVLLVPGYGGATGGASRLAARIRTTGRMAKVVELPGNGTGDLRAQAAALNGYVDRALATGAASVDIVGQSAGGVVARLWVQEHDGVHKARRVITLGSPHHGTQLAATGSAFLPGACPPACRQLIPGSRFLTGLAAPVPDPPSWLALWTTQDTVVTPPESARLEGALNVSVQSVCPGIQVTHSGLATDPTVIRIVLAALRAGPLAPPDPRVC
jgi:alpha-beta hydrolase superfamily lysophospholipase